LWEGSKTVRIRTFWSERRREEDAPDLVEFEIRLGRSSTEALRGKREREEMVVVNRKKTERH